MYDPSFVNGQLKHCKYDFKPLAGIGSSTENDQQMLRIDLNIKTPQTTKNQIAISENPSQPKILAIKYNIDDLKTLDYDKIKDNETELESIQEFSIKKPHEIQQQIKKTFGRRQGSHIVTRSRLENNESPSPTKRQQDVVKKSQNVQQQREVQRRPSEMLTKKLELRKLQSSQIGYTPKYILSSPQMKDKENRGKRFSSFNVSNNSTPNKIDENNQNNIYQSEPRRKSSSHRQNIQGHAINTNDNKSEFNVKDRYEQIKARYGFNEGDGYYSQNDQYVASPYRRFNKQNSLNTSKNLNNNSITPALPPAISIKNPIGSQSQNAQTRGPSDINAAHAFNNKLFEIMSPNSRNQYQFSIGATNPTNIIMQPAQNSESQSNKLQIIPMQGMKLITDQNEILKNNGVNVLSPKSTLLSPKPFESKVQKPRYSIGASRNSPQSKIAQDLKVNFNKKSPNLVNQQQAKQ